MFERCLNEAERVLSVHREGIVPVKRLWEEVAKEGKRARFEVSSLADFTALLEGDRRFVILPANQEPDETADAFDEAEEEEDGMGSLGFYPEDRVRLHTLMPAPKAEEIAEADEEVGSIRRKSFAAPSTGSPVKKGSTGGSPRRSAKTPSVQSGTRKGTGKRPHKHPASTRRPSGSRSRRSSA